ncbi:MAG: long-chain fatty acid--CoA ligase [Nitrospinae bacterium]|nr:long-chain fatty acid--CoA ligase [Nitrospinota bacterium]
MKDYISPQEAGSLPGLLIERVKRTPDAPALRQFDEATGAWFQKTWREVYKTVAWARNSMEWVFFDMATLACGLVVVPIYIKESHSNIVHIFNDSGARLLIIEDVETWNALAPIHSQLKDLMRVLIVKPFKDSKKTGLVRYINDWVCHENLEVQIHEDVTADSNATVVYTSGTTGLPKGVLLTHNNIMSNAWASLQYFDVFREDVFLSFLPLTHMFERTAGYYLPVMSGATICYARNVKTVGEDLVTQKPTLMICVPLVLQRTYEKIMAAMKASSPVKRAVFNLTLGVGKKRFLKEQGKGGWHPLLLLWPLLFKLVGKKVLDGMGGRLRTIVSGGAPLPPEIWKMFVYLGIPVVQGYGMTEASPVISVNKPLDNVEGSVGAPLPGVEAKIAPTGELLAKGPLVMKGYWNNPGATAEVIDKDGWLHTGDVGEIRDGYLFITDRLKQIIVMSNGEKVPPERLEMAVRDVPLFGNVMVYGERRPYLILIAEVNAPMIEEFAHVMGVSTDGGRHIYDERLQTALLALINEKLSGFPAYAKIKKLHLTNDVWSPDNSLTTNTLKIRRKAIVQHYSAEIEALYSQPTAPHR